MVLYYEMIQMIEMFVLQIVLLKKRLTRLTLEKLNDGSVHFAEKAEKAVCFLRELFMRILA